MELGSDGLLEHNEYTWTLWVSSIPCKTRTKPFNGALEGYWKVENGFLYYG